MNLHLRYIRCAGPLILVLTGLPGLALAQGQSIASARVRAAFQLTEHRITQSPLDLEPEAVQRWFAFTLAQLDDAGWAQPGVDADFHIWWSLLPFSHEPQVAQLLELLEERIRTQHLEYLPMLLHDAVLCHRPGSDATEIRWRAVVLADRQFTLPAARIQLAVELLENSGALALTEARLLVEAALEQTSVTEHELLAWRMLHRDIELRLEALGGSSPQLDVQAHQRLSSEHFDVIGCVREWNRDSLQPPQITPYARPSQESTGSGVAESHYQPWDESDAWDLTPPKPAPVIAPHRTKTATQHYQPWDDDGRDAPRYASVATAVGPSPYQPFSDDDVVRSTSHKGYQPFGGLEAGASRNGTTTTSYEAFGDFEPAAASYPSGDRLPEVSWRIEEGRPAGAQVVFEGARESPWSFVGEGWWYGHVIEGEEGVMAIDWVRPATREHLLITELTRDEPGEMSTAFLQWSRRHCADAAPGLSGRAGVIARARGKTCDGALLSVDGGARIMVFVLGSTLSLEERLPQLFGGS